MEKRGAHYSRPEWPLLIDSMTALDLTAAGILIFATGDGRRTPMRTKIPILVLVFVLVLVAVAAWDVAFRPRRDRSAPMPPTWPSSRWARASTPNAAPRATAPSSRARRAGAAGGPTAPWRRRPTTPPATPGITRTPSLFDYTKQGGAGVAPAGFQERHAGLRGHAYGPGDLGRPRLHQEPLATHHPPAPGAHQRRGALSRSAPRVASQGREV